MKHYIILKFKNEYDYTEHAEEISELFNNAMQINGVSGVKLRVSNSDLSNRYDLMIEMELTKKALKAFDDCWIHKKWKDDYGRYLADKVIFDCE
ncbi:MAG: hypothetical protein IKD94_00770 [Erysipelotrichaceae bacterium]|nr:hypothetical protein [Erysipelotrichaceae bacterium]